MPKVVGFGSSVRSGVKSGDAEMEPERGDYIYNSLQLRVNNFESSTVRSVGVTSSSCL